MKQIHCLLTYLFSFFICAQNDYNGILLDSLSEEPLPYATIIWSNLDGVITNEEGRYQLFIDTVNDSTQLIISHLGYHDLNVKLRDLKDTLYLSPQTYELDEVVIIDTDDLKNKVAANFEKNYTSDLVCEEFFYKQFLKENGQYVNYLEAIGFVKWPIVDKEIEVFIKGVRKTDDLITSYINHSSGGIPRLLMLTTRDILGEGEIIDYKWLTSEIVEAHIEDSKSKENYYLTINTNDYSIQKVTKNNLTNEIDNKYNNTTIRIEGKKVEFDGYLQGALLQYEYKKTGDKYHLHRIYHKGKGILVSTDGALKHQFISEQLYLKTNILNACNEKQPYVKLRKDKSLRRISTKYDKDDWSRLNAILPLKEEKQILDDLGKVQ